MCTNSTQPDFYFDNAGKPYLANDIDPGTAGALHPGTIYQTKISVHNSGMVAAPAKVRLYVCPPGTNVTAGTAIFLGEHNTALDVPACAGSNDGTRSGAGALASTGWTFGWDPGSYFTPSPGHAAIHMCLFAQVRCDGSVLGTTATAYPTNSDPTTPQNAQHNIDVVDVVYPLKRQVDPEQFFGFGIANPTAREIKGQVVIRVIRGTGKEQAAFIAGSPRLSALLGKGTLRKPSRATVVLGKERIVVPREFAEKTDAYSRDAHPALRSFRLGHTGELDRETFRLLSDGKASPSREVVLVPGEVRQGMVRIVPPEDTKPGEIFVLDIRHEVAASGRTKMPMLIGGLVLVVRAVKSRPRSTAK